MDTIEHLANELHGRAAGSKLPILFRSECDGSIIAVFPTIPGRDAYTMTCYAHIGQHSSCSMGWYYSTRPAHRNKYADLLGELTQIYNEYELVVVKRISSAMRKVRSAGL